MASCSICYDDNKIKNDYNCRTCNNSVCNTCFSNILSYDDNFRICIIYNIPIIYKCSFCKTENRLDWPEPEMDTAMLGGVGSGRGSSAPISVGDLGLGSYLLGSDP